MLSNSIIYAAIVAAFLTGAVLSGGPASAQQAMPPSKIQELMKQTLPEVPGRETRVLTIDLPPGGGSPPHRHPGHHIFGYVLEGSYRFKVGDKPEVTLKPGDTFYEAPGELHAVSSNASRARSSCHTPRSGSMIRLVRSRRRVNDTNSGNAFSELR